MIQTLLFPSSLEASVLAETEVAIAFEILMVSKQWSSLHEHQHVAVAADAVVSSQCLV